MPDPIAPCADPFPPNRHLTCVRVPGHAGRHVWVSDLPEATSSSSLTWRDHPADCTCAYHAPPPRRPALYARNPALDAGDES